MLFVGHPPAHPPCPAWGASPPKHCLFLWHRKHHICDGLHPICLETSPLILSHILLANTMSWWQTSFRVGSWWWPSSMRWKEQEAWVGLTLLIPHHPPQRGRVGPGGVWGCLCPQAHPLTTSPKILLIAIHSFIFKVSFFQVFFFF